MVLSGFKPDKLVPVAIKDKFLLGYIFGLADMGAFQLLTLEALRNPAITLKFIAGVTDFSFPGYGKAITKVCLDNQSDAEFQRGR